MSQVGQPLCFCNINPLTTSVYINLHFLIPFSELDIVFTLRTIVFKNFLRRIKDLLDPFHYLSAVAHATQVAYRISNPDLPMFAWLTYL